MGIENSSSKKQQGQESTKPQNSGFSLENSRWAVTATVFVFLVILTLGFLATNWGNGSQPGLIGNEISNGTSANSSANATEMSDATKLKLENFLDANFLASTAYTANISNVTPYGDHLDLVEINLMKAGQVVKVIPIYATANGDTVILNADIYQTNAAELKAASNAKTTGISVTAPATAQASAPATAPAPAAAAVKSDRPKVQLFVMAYCPYGLQMLKAYEPVMELLGNKTDMTVDFVYYSMHGKKEIDANNYLYCVQKEQQPKFNAYLRCFIETGDATNCIATAGVDKSSADSCVSALDAQYNITAMYNDKSTWLSGSYPLYPVEAALNKQYGVAGSPTLVINGKQASSPRVADSVKQVICSSFNTPPAECNTKLSTVAEAAGNGKIGAGTSAASSGGCGG